MGRLSGRYSGRDSGRHQWIDWKKYWGMAGIEMGNIAFEGAGETSWKRKRPGERGGSTEA